MTKFIAWDDKAVEEMVSGRSFQSTDFGFGNELAAFLKGRVVPEQIGPLRTYQEAGGVFVVSAESERNSARFIVLDLEQSKMFLGLSDSDSLFAFQKIMRFARKWWAGGQGLTYAEKIISGTSKAVVFPFRYQPQPYRAVIEREPWKERLGKRGLSGRFLLVYKAGYSGGDSAGEEPENTNFKKVIESYESVLQQEAVRSRSVERESEAQLQVTDLSRGLRSGVGSLFRSFNEWMPALTKQQSDFVLSPLAGPHRIEGAAGTGKTLSLVLKAVAALRQAEDEGVQRNIVFITHSDATRASISEVLSVIDAEKDYQNRILGLSQQSLTVTTLTQLCAEKLRHAISESEFIDRDAMESKGLQRLYIAEAIEEAIDKDLPAHSRFMTPEFVELMKTESSWNLSQIFQHEISVLIKGRAAERFEIYRDARCIRYGLPAQTSADKAFAFAVFKRYRDKLAIGGQFDTDDVVLTAIGQLDTPIWKRRRSKEGFDAIFIDETHLFNINELHLFHYFTRGDSQFPIIYSIDKSQAVGDPGWTTQEMENAVANPAAIANMDASPGEGESVKVGTIFRSSPEIVDLAFCVVSSGATLFTNFENPMVNASSAFTTAEESLAQPPMYSEAPNEEALIELAFQRADALQAELSIRRADVLICTLDDALLGRLSEYASGLKRPVKILARRGDVQAIDQAVAGGMYVVGHADYVGGLEFGAVVLVGVDDGRVPPVQGAEADAARHFLNYSAHNRLYVAITRAKYRVEILGEAARGVSKILEPAIANGLLKQR
ncbi:UvrD-helicase domain-containing protein [Dyella sp.]|jgi:superfamily I DNA/RNA helicase|uniref:UvrD-helicase domain-containing protein n=1 Tax=Dyella sp. TaxID=1869338 RepID=UPI002D79D873|nr:UvrD-helicase domain-containing protein [Dyella sp.]HET6431249.1 UvrD-helicase domain-containing protein [Dyella sp.]